MSERTCFLCNHPLRGSIDGILRSCLDEDEDEDLHDLALRINYEIEAVYGSDAKKCSTRDVQGHLEHKLVPIGSNIQLADNKQIIQMGGREYTVPTVEEAIVAILACGIHNLRMRPELVTPSHMLRALQELRQAGMSFEEGTLEDKILEKMREIDDEAEGPMRPLDV